MSDKAFGVGRGRKRVLIVTSVAILAVLLITAAVFFIYVGNYYSADTEAITAFLATAETEHYEDEAGNLIFAPESPRAGFIFYQGGKVERDAYVPLMSALADRGIFCVLTEMPFNLAVFDISAADGVMEQYPEIERWYLGGHSLGGAMAASYLADNPDSFHGLVLLGAYSTSDISGLDIAVLSAYGSEDGVLDIEKYGECKSNLPADFTELVIDGGCHAYFGMYGEQKGDGAPSITASEQINITADAIERLTRTDHFVATVLPNDKVTSSPYTGDGPAPDGFEGIYYSSSEPGGRPKADGTGNIWLKIVPTDKNKVSRLSVKGEYSYVEKLGNDLYCIHGVGSDITVTVVANKMLTSKDELLSDIGYGITDEGNMVFNWAEDPETPIRYLELTYTDGQNEKTLRLDAGGGSQELFKMTENLRYSFKAQAIGYDRIGKAVEFDCCYMTEPREVGFPRVEIVTDNYYWPTFDVVNSPDKYWGQGITNAEYEQCVITIYNENNEVVFDSSSEMNDSQKFLGAKMKVRGNTSASQTVGNKHPYKIKLDSKADLLKPLIGREDEKTGYADKNWLLLNYGEDGYRIAGDAIADAVGTEWSPDYCYVSLYVNGDYRGLYVLSESIKEGNGEGDDQWRVPISADGYLFECDAYWWNESLYFNTPMTQNTAMFFTFKYPDADILYTNSPEVLYIKDYMTRFEEALKMNDESYSSYIGVHSFAKWLLVSDYLSISDAGGCNIYLYKADATDGTKVMMGPNWDFDSWMGDVRGLSGIRTYWNGSPFYYPFIVQKPYFQAVYNELFEESKLIVQDYVDEAFDKIDMDAHSELLAYDSARYGVEYKELSRIKAEFDSWFEEHIVWMDTQFN